MCCPIPGTRACGKASILDRNTFSHVIVVLPSKSDFTLKMLWMHHMFSKVGKIIPYTFIPIRFFLGTRIVKEKKGYNFPYEGKIRTKILIFGSFLCSKIRVYRLYP